MEKEGMLSGTADMIFGSIFFQPKIIIQLFCVCPTVLLEKERDSRVISDWKVEERGRFLSLLQAEGKRRLLEIGAGAGHHARFFQDSGLEVVCTDLSPELVRLCQEKGLTAYVMDFMGLDFPAGS